MIFSAAFFHLKIIIQCILKLSQLYVSTNREHTYNFLWYVALNISANFPSLLRFPLKTQATPFVFPIRWIFRFRYWTTSVLESLCSRIGKKRNANMFQYWSDGTHARRGDRAVMRKPTPYSCTVQKKIKINHTRLRISNVLVVSIRCYLVHFKRLARRSTGFGFFRGRPYGQFERL